MVNMDHTLLTSSSKNHCYINWSNSKIDPCISIQPSCIYFQIFIYIPVQMLSGFILVIYIIDISTAYIEVHIFNLKHQGQVEDYINFL